MAMMAVLYQAAPGAEKHVQAGPRSQATFSRREKVGFTLGLRVLAWWPAARFKVPRPSHPRILIGG